MSTRTSKLHIVLLGTQMVLESFSEALSQTIAFAERNGTHRLNDDEVVQTIRKQVQTARAALDLTEEYMETLVAKDTSPAKAMGHSTTGLCKECGQLRLVFKNGPRPKKNRNFKDIEGCPDYPEIPRSDEEE